MEIVGHDVVEILNSFSPQEAVLIIVFLMVLYIIGLTIIKVLDVLVDLFRSKVMKKHGSKKEKVWHDHYLDRSADINLDINNKLRDIAQINSCDRVTVWLFSNSGCGLNGLSFYYQSCRFEYVTHRAPSIIVSGVKMPVEATPTLRNNLMRSKPIATFVFDVNNCDMQDVLIFKAYQLKSVAVLPLTSNGSVVGCLAVSWIFNRRETDFSEEDKTELGKQAAAIDVLLGQLEESAKVKSKKGYLK